MKIETQAILFGLAGLSILGLALFASKSPALPSGSPQPPLPITPPIRDPGPAASPLKVHSVTLDSPTGSSLVRMGDRLRIQGIPPGFLVKRSPDSAIRQLSANDFVFQGPGTTTVVWADRTGEMRSFLFQLS